MTLEILSTRPEALTDGADVAVVPVAPDLDAAERDALAQTLVDAIARRGEVVVDFAETRACDAALLDLLRMVDAEAKTAQASLEFRRVLPPVRHALEHAHLDWRIQLVGEHGA